MDIVVRYDGRVCKLVKKDAMCCTKGFGSCTATGKWCEEGLCSGRDGHQLSDILGHNMGWHKLEYDDGPPRVLVVYDDIAYEVVAGRCWECDMERKEVCKKYCASRLEMGLPKLLARFLRNDREEMHIFKRVSV